MSRPEPAQVVRLSAIVHGRVQGVGFRYSAQAKARDLELHGYVRNHWDRTVEAVAEGPEESVRQFLSWLHVGPSMAQVSRVDVEWQPPLGDASTFEVRF